MDHTFQNAFSFNQPIGNWSVAKVTDMVCIFCSTRWFNQPLGDWNVAKVTRMGCMFSYALAFNQPLGDWSARLGSVTDMTAMFYRALAFDQDLGWCLDADVLANDMFTDTPCGPGCGVTQPVGGCPP